MGRKSRVWYPGAVYHVMSRGNRKFALFQKREDYNIFLQLTRSVMDKNPYVIHAYCLMTNHFHLLIETKEDPLWVIMHKILGNYAQHYNYKYHYNGHLFENRYTSRLIEDDRYFLEVRRYIHLNPVKAALVQEPLANPYSSYRNYILEDDKTLPDHIETDRVLGLFPIDSKKEYRIFVEGSKSHEDQERLIMKDMRENEFWVPK